MSATRRAWLGAGLGLGVAGAASLAGSWARADAAAGYRALVVVFLDGGNDGHNCLIPIDAGYGDYQASRTNLALSKASLLTLSGTHDGRRYGIHPALAPLRELHESGRLVWIANVGPLVQPSSARQVLDGAAEVPPFLLSHPEQVKLQQGWTGDVDSSGWAGRGLEGLPLVLRTPLAAVTLGTKRTLVQGRASSVAFLPSTRPQYWGYADLKNPASVHTQRLLRMARSQFANRYINEYARTLGGALDDSQRIVAAMPATTAVDPAFGTDRIGSQLNQLAELLPGFKSLGLRRQVFLVTRGGFDTHADQRGSAATTQDAQLDIVARALAAFDAATVRAGLDGEVVTLVMSDFGRTLRPGSGGGSEHGWGNHWWLLGGAVKGGSVTGVFPSLVLGGADDGDRGRNGRLVPSISTDQVGATLMQWLGLDSSQLHDVFPWLVNFAQKTVPGLLRA